MQRPIRAGIYRLVSFSYPAGVSCYYLVDAKTNCIASLAPRNFKGEIIGPIEKPSKRNAYFANLKYQKHTIHISEVLDAIMPQ